MTDFPLAPGATIGILGGGQLGRMLALAAARLGFDVAVLTPHAEDCALRVAAKRFVAPYQDHGALEGLARASDVITFEFENVPADAVGHLSSLGASVAPGPRALAVSQDRVDEKSFLNTAGIPTVAFAPVQSVDQLEAALQRLGPRLLLKTRRGGYDGKGQTWVEGLGDAAAALARLGGQACIAEAPADFRRELAIIAARGRSGDIALYPVTQSQHEAGILRRTLAPADCLPETTAQAGRMATDLLTALDYVGVLGLELFELGDGRLLVNEFAPRVHNTGHWTLNGCEVDQFEQHIRAVAGWPLGPTHPIAQVEMTNLLGDDVANWPSLISDVETRIWLYGKGEARPGRKMGHVNRLSKVQG